MRIGLALLGILTGLTAHKARAENLAITDTTLITLEGDARVGTLLIKGDRIESIEDASFKVDPKVYRVIPGRGRFVIPGLFDSHVHFFQSGGLYTRPDALDLRFKVPYASQEFPQNFKNVDTTLRRYLASGVTSLVDVGGPMENFKVRDSARKLPHAPTVYVAGPLLSTVSRDELDVADKPIVKITSLAEASQWIDKLVAQKPDFIKIWYVIPPGGTWKDHAELVQSMIAESHRKGQRVAVHATELDTARAAVQFGADVLVHSIEDKPVDQDFIHLLKEKKVHYIPALAVTEGYRKTYRQLVTFSPLDYQTGDPNQMGTLFDLPHLPFVALPERVRQAMIERNPVPKPAIEMQNLKALAEAGVSIIMGTDAGNTGTFHGSAIYREMELMAEAGLKALDILRMSTLTGARMMKVDHELGSIKPGKKADLVLLERDPRADIRNIQYLQLVIKNGRPFTRSELLPQSPAAIVQSQLNAYHALDTEAFLKHFTPDARAGLYKGKQTQGIDAIRETWGGLFAKAEWIRLRIAERVVQGNYVFDVECGFFKGKDKDSKPRFASAAALYKIHDGLIEEMLMVNAENGVVKYPSEIKKPGSFRLDEACRNL